MPAAFNCKIIAIFDFLLSIGMVPGLNHDLDDDPSDRDRRKVPSLGSVSGRFGAHIYQTAIQYMEAR